MPRTIDDIIPPSRRRMMNANAEKNNEATAPPSYMPQTPNNSTPLQPTSASPNMSDMVNRSHLENMSPKQPAPPSKVRIRVSKSFPYGTALIVLVIIAVCAGILYALAGAEVKITPTTQTGTVSGDFTATNGEGDLPYKVVTVSKTASAVVPAESTLTANDSAQGTIIISNAQATSQQLIVNTRFETSEGLIFKIHAPVTIPAAGASGPGTLSATVFADAPGANYNVGPTTFTVPGLKGGSSYILVTAKSLTPMAGGFSGVRPAVSQATDDAHHATLQSALSTTIQSALASQIPPGYVVVPGGSTTTYQAQPDTASSTSVAITEQGTVTAIAFPSDAFAKALAYKIAGTYSGEPISLQTVSTLNLTPAATSTDAASASTFTFSLSGNATVIWKVDASRIAGAVAGKTRSSAQSILAGFPEINSATLILRPFWSDTFPQDPSHIHVLITPPPVAK